VGLLDRYMYDTPGNSGIRVRVRVRCWVIVGE